jgi:acetolactate synthase-1/2/3 large subunit
MTNGAAAPSATVAQLLAKYVKAQGVTRVFGLQGGHIQPLWDELDRLGVEIVDVRHEVAAVYMAHAHAELTGELGFALATAGPGVTNTLTGVANATVSRAPVVVIGGTPPRPQNNMSPLQEIPQVAVMQPVTRYARCIDEPEHAVRELDRAVAASLGDLGEAGASYIEFPTDVLREPVLKSIVAPELFERRAPRIIEPDPALIAEAAAAIRAARRPVLISGRGARGAGAEIAALLENTGALYLDTQESRGVLPDDHPAVVTALRGLVMQEADLVITVGRKLDYQLGYGSPAVFPHARFVRIASTPVDLIDNRRGVPEIVATPKRALAALVNALAGRGTSQVDTAWTESIRKRHRERVDSLDAKLAAAPAGADGFMHPNRIFAAIRATVPADAVAIADGGDILSFARLGFTNATYLDSGAFGCLGVGVPFAVAAALADPARAVVLVNGDGAFGFNALEIDTAVRHNAKAVFIVANNGAWNIERYDQIENYGGRVVGTELNRSDYAALARSLGAHGERVERPEDLEGALKRALANAPALIDVLTTRDAVSSDGAKGLGNVPLYQALADWDVAERKRREPTLAHTS